MEATTYDRERSSTAEGRMLDDSTKPQPSGDDTQSLSAVIQSGRPSTDLITDPKKWQCCCCCHVRKVTIVICVLRLFLGIAGLGVLFHNLTATDDSHYGVLKPHGMKSREWLQMINNSSVTSRDSSIVSDGNSDLNKIPEEIPRSEHPDDLTIKYSKIYSGIASSLLIIVLSSLTLYGAVKIKPTFMIPSITIDAIYFVLECGVYVIGVIVLSCLQLWTLLIFLMVVGLKIPFHGYFIYIFWRCYKFCLLQREVISTGGFLSTEMRAGKFQCEWA